MFVNRFDLLMGSSPFYEAYISSDFLGKMIFLSIVATSICSWSLFVYKIILTRRARLNSLAFYKMFSKSKASPLNIENEGAFKRNGENPYFEVYFSLKKFTIELLTKNRKFGSNSQESYLYSSDIDCIASHLGSCLDIQIKNLEKNIFILSTIVGLAPLLGLLGTVWGILTTFSELQSQAGSATNQMVLGGISLALTTTVLGLLSAMPALIAYNYLKNSIRNFGTDMESAANEMLSSVEMQYRKVS